jgi:hypothetical protein
MELIELYNNLKRFNQEIDQFVDDFIIDNQSSFVDANIEQLARGEDAEGKAMPVYRNPEYAAMKRSMGSRSGDRWDLNLFGDFTGRMKMDNSKNIFSTDSKSAKLLKATQSVDLDIFGVQPRMMDELIKDQLLGDFQTATQKSLGLI